MHIISSGLQVTFGVIRKCVVWVLKQKRSMREFDSQNKTDSKHLE